MNIEKSDSRLKFDLRINTMREDTLSYYNQITEYLLSYKYIKNRQSTRCESFRYAKNLVAKICIGGKTLKLYLALDPNDEFFVDKKYHQRNISATKAYEEVPCMLPIKSQLAVRKACEVIDYLMTKYDTYKM